MLSSSTHIFVSQANICVYKFERSCWVCQRGTLNLKSRYISTPLRRAHLRFRDWVRRVALGHFLLVGEASVRSTAGRLGRTEADLMKSSTAVVGGDLPATIMD